MTALTLRSGPQPASDLTTILNAVIEDINDGFTMDTLGVNGQVQIGQVASAAIWMGGGTAASPLAIGSTADKNAMGFWFNSTATSGDARGLYLRTYFSGAGGSGEAARIFGTVNGVTAATGGTVNGAHISLSVTGASGAVSGAGNALRATLGLGASVNAGGTLSIIQVDTDFDTAATVAATVAGLRFTTSNVKKLPVAAAFDGVVGSGNAIEAATSNMGTAATAWALHIQIDGVDGYIPVFDNKTWS